MSFLDILVTTAKCQLGDDSISIIVLMHQLVMTAISIAVPTAPMLMAGYLLRINIHVTDMNLSKPSFQPTGFTGLLLQFPSLL